MDEFTRHINEMNDCLQSFGKNNRILSDNWKDDQAEKFSQSILVGMTNSSKSFVQLIENDRNGILPEVILTSSRKENTRWNGSRESEQR